MNDTIELKISHKSMEKIIENYFKKFNRNVKAKIYSYIDTDRFAGDVRTLIRVTEKVVIAGVESKTSGYLLEDELEKIVAESLDSNQKVDELTNVARTQKYIKGSYTDEHYESRIVDKNYFLRIRTKTKRR